MKQDAQRGHPPLSASAIQAIQLALVNHVATHVQRAGATLAIVAESHLQHVRQPTPTEQALLSLVFGAQGVGDRIDWLRSCPPHFAALYGDLPQYSPDYIRNIFAPVATIHTRRGRANQNYRSPWVNIIDGLRHTPGQPQVYANSVFMVGNSGVYGMGCEDAHTLPALLQRLLNRRVADVGQHWAVFNLGVRGAPPFANFFRILQLRLRPGDRVILHGLPVPTVRALAALAPDLPVLVPNLSRRDRDIFFDREHVNYRGNQLLARQIYRRLWGEPDAPRPAAPVWQIPAAEMAAALAVLAEHARPFTALQRPAALYPGLQDYIDELAPLSLSPGVVGATVVNCNPFTRGHRHLIAHAASRVDHLLVFVVEEDLSQFAFRDRLAMVRAGTRDLANVSVVRSGRYMMSAFTCPEYFAKDSDTRVIVDASRDLDLFAEFIAPRLGIQVRFIGAEPHCAITRQHNEQMRHILPTHGIRVEEINRLTCAGVAISASRVRQLLRRRDLAAVRPLVPATSAEFLQDWLARQALEEFPVPAHRGERLDFAGQSE